MRTAHIFKRTALMRTASVLALSVLLAGGFAGTPAKAETLVEALASAYSDNPLIRQERARVRATDEDLARAQSGYRPRISANADYGISNQSTGAAPVILDNGQTPTPAQIKANERGIQRPDGFRHPHSYGFQLQQPLFDGGSTVGAVREADANIRAAREKMRAVEQKVLLDTVKAYTAVIRDRSAVGLRESGVTLLSRELAGTRERFSAGEATRTDVAQAESRKARAAAGMEQAKADLRSSLAEYQRVVGHPATSLSTPPIAKATLPDSLEDAVQISQTENPDVVEAAYREEAAEHQITKIEGELLPQLTLSASHLDRYDISRTIENQQTQSVTARLNIPLYSGGDTEARIRAAKQERQGRLEGVEQARQQGQATTITAWSQMVADRAQVTAVKEQVRAATAALLGVREEQRAGQRTLIDVLNSAEELIEAKIALERAKRNLVVSSYGVLSAVGRLTAVDLGLNVSLYDPDVNYSQTNRRGWGISVDREAQYGME
jgi:outer membrane protein